MPSVDKDVEQIEFSYISVEMQIGIGNLEIVLQFHIKFNIHIPNNQQLHSYVFILEKLKHISMQRLALKWYSIFIHNNLKLETTQIFINRFNVSGM